MFWEDSELSPPASLIPQTARGSHGHVEPPALGYCHRAEGGGGGRGGECSPDVTVHFSEPQHMWCWEGSFLVKVKICQGRKGGQYCSLHPSAVQYKYF